MGGSYAQDLRQALLDSSPSTSSRPPQYSGLGGSAELQEFARVLARAGLVNIRFGRKGDNKYNLEDLTAHCVCVSPYTR
jgi:hypothetical protein